MKRWLDKIYEIFSKKTPPRIEPAAQQDFGRSEAKRPYVFRAYGVAYGFEFIVHRFEAKRFSSGLLYAMPSAGRKLVERILANEPKEEDRKLFRFLSCYPTGGVSIQPTHFLSISYDFIRDGSRVVLLQMPLNFRVPGMDSDYICEQCCEFAVNIILQSSLQKDAVKVEKPNLMLTTNSTSTRIFWLTMIFVRYRWFFQPTNKL